VDRIVAATDFSDEAGHAVRRAARLAARHGAELELLHVVDGASLDAVRAWVREPSDLAERVVADARRVLAQCAADLSAASQRVAVGDVMQQIASSCAGADLLVIGAHGANPLRDVILGTTAARLVGKCQAPVLVVRRPAVEDYRNVLAAVDLLPGSDRTLAEAAGIAPGAHLSALHAYDVPLEAMLQRAGVTADELDRHRAQAFRSAFDAIRDSSKALSGDAEQFLPVVERGEAARLLIERAGAIAADLIVIGKRRRSAVETLVLGSVTRHVLADASADVLVVPIPAG
jgi:CPA2 family monovalent cation:H+ antiporter-2